jgi:hypothetical protein
MDAGKVGAMDMSTMLKRGVVLLAISTALIIGGRYMSDANVQAHEQRKTVVCPSFLSIARSARDTLIVMRNEPLCTEYVLDNLQ